jgi:hypothetical protein
MVILTINHVLLEVADSGAPESEQVADGIFQLDREVSWFEAFGNSHSKEGLLNGLGGGGRGGHGGQGLLRAEQQNYNPRAPKNIGKNPKGAAAPLITLENTEVIRGTVALK